MKSEPDIRIKNAFKEKQFYVGITQTGKTNALCYHLSRATIPYTVWDETGTISRLLRPFNPRTQRIIRPPVFPKLQYITKKEAKERQDKKLEAFDSLCHKVMSEGNQIFVVDEVHTFCTKRSISYEFNELITKGGNLDVGFIGTSQSVAQVSNIILGNTLHFWIFKTAVPNDIEWLGKFIDKKIVEQSQFLPDYAYIYYKLGGKAEKYAPVPNMSLFY